MDENMNIIGERVKARRKELKLTQTDIYNKSGISSGTLSKIENGSLTPSILIFYKLSQILKCDMEWLLTGTSSYPKNFASEEFSAEAKGIVERIQNLCMQKGIKIKPLEESLGIANGSIKRWNDSSPSCDRLLKIAKYFNVSVDWLLTGKNFSFDNFIQNDQELSLLLKFRSLPSEDQDEMLEILSIRLRKLKRAKEPDAKSSLSQDEKMA